MVPVALGARIFSATPALTCSPVFQTPTSFTSSQTYSALAMLMLAPISNISNFWSILLEFFKLSQLTFHLKSSSV